MSVSPTAITSALNALKQYSRRVDRAAEAIAAAGLGDLAAPPGDSTSQTDASVPTSEAPDLADAMTSMLIAQRAFVAQLRVLRTADEMLKETVDSVKR